MRKKINRLWAVGLLVLVGCSGTASALQSSSSHYGVDQVEFNNGGVICDPGTNGSQSYCASQSLGEPAVGNSASQSYQIQAGSDVAERQDSLELILNSSYIDVGTLQTTTTKVATATFSVKSYLADGYAVYTSSPGPQNGGYTMHAPSSPGASAVGTEQFGINLVANSCPGAAVPSGPGSCNSGFGSNASQVPDSSFSFGQPTANYNTSGSYMYKDGDRIAYSSSSSGETDYTISYIFNISAVTPGGTYTMQQSIVATATF